MTVRAEQGNKFSRDKLFNRPRFLLRGKKRSVYLTKRDAVFKKGKQLLITAVTRISFNVRDYRSYSDLVFQRFDIVYYAVVDPESDASFMQTIEPAFAEEFQKLQPVLIEALKKAITDTGYTFVSSSCEEYKKRGLFAAQYLHGACDACGMYGWQHTRTDS